MERSPEQIKLDALSEKAWHSYVTSPACARGLPGPSSLYEHGWQDGRKSLEARHIKLLALIVSALPHMESVANLPVIYKAQRERGAGWVLEAERIVKSFSEE